MVHPVSCAGFGGHAVAEHLDLVQADGIVDGGR
jgi:hypothetical protein